MNKKNENYVLGLEKELENNTLSIFCSDTISIGEAFRSIVQQYFGKGTMDSLQELGEVLKGIHTRLTLEGYVLVDGKYYKKKVI